VNRD
jgi:phospholipid-transporting ATPase